MDEDFSLTAEGTLAAVDAEALASSLCGAFGDDAAVPLTRINQLTRTVMTTSQNPGSANLPPAPD